MRVSNLKKIIENFLNNNKASNIISIDLKKKSHIADYMIIASGTSSRHLQSLSENLILELKKTGIENCRMEGKESEDASHKTFGDPSYKDVIICKSQPIIQE